jgi:hypothetical protein
VVVTKKQEKVRVKSGLVILDDNYGDTLEMETVRGLFLVLDDLMVEREIRMVASSGVVGLKKKLRLLVMEFDSGDLEEDRGGKSWWLILDRFVMVESEKWRWMMALKAMGIATSER